jgi:hypothetical protein
MRCAFFTICVYFLLPRLAGAQGLFDAAGAFAAGKGGTSVVDQNPYAVFNNPAGIVGDSATFGFFSSMGFGIKQLAQTGISADVALGKTKFGAGLRQFGFELYKQQQFSLVLARQLSGIISMGISASWVQTSISEYGSTGNLIGDAGLVAQLSRKTRVALHFINVGNNQLKHDFTGSIPCMAVAGISYHLSRELNFQAEYGRYLSDTALLRFGAIYDLKGILSVSMGYVTGGMQADFISFGIGGHWRKFRFDFATSRHELLGFTPYFSVIYKR